MTDELRISKSIKFLPIPCTSPQSNGCTHLPQICILLSCSAESLKGFIVYNLGSICKFYLLTLGNLYSQFPKPR